jgi:hypothetical protein
MKAIFTPKYIEFYQGGKWKKVLNVGATLKAEQADEPKGKIPKRTGEGSYKKVRWAE